MDNQRFSHLNITLNQNFGERHDIPQMHFTVSDLKWLMKQAEECDLLGRKFDALVKATAKVDGQYATLHREWRKEKEDREQMEVSLKELEKELEEMTEDRNIYRSNSLDWQGEVEEE